MLNENLKYSHIFHIFNKIHYTFFFKGENIYFECFIIAIYSLFRIAN